MGKFYEYLYGNNFVIYMDNNLFIYIMPSTKLDVQVIIGLLAWQIIILPGAIDQERWMWIQMLSPTFQGEHDWHIEAGSVHAPISQVGQGTTYMEANSCNI